jgi:two-component system CheB/CheR fusion protein
MNEELRRKTGELDRVNAYLESILGALRAGVMVVDTDMVVQIWNERAEDLWGVRRDEAYGAHLLNLDSGLPVERLREPIRTALAEGPQRQELKLTATNRRGRQIECLLTVRALQGEDGFRGAVILMEDVSDR